MSDQPRDVGPASFRVYRPEELRTAPMRPSFRPAHLSSEPAPPTSTRSMLAYLGVGMALGALALGLVVALGYASDDFASPKGRSSTAVDPNAPVIELGEAPAANLTTPVVVAPAEPPTDFEIPDSPSLSPGARKAKAARSRVARAP
jgi:hypothetical protein